MDFVRIACSFQARIEQRRLKVFPVPVGDSKKAMPGLGFDKVSRTLSI